MFKIGDVVECVNGIGNGGSGFILGRTFQVTLITYSGRHRRPILWGNIQDHGVYGSHVTLKVADGLLTPDEMHRIKQLNETK